MTQTSQQLSTIPVTHLKGVGPKLAALLQKRQINTIQDLLLHLPYRYQDRTRITAIRDLRPNDHRVIEASIMDVTITYGKRRTMTCQLADGTGKVTLRFFHFSMAQKNNLVKGEKLRCFGEVRLGRGGLEMVHPEYRHVQGNESLAVEEHLTPIYPTTEGLSQVMLRRLITQSLSLLEQGHVFELPTAFAAQWELSSLKEALHFCHNPPPDASVEKLIEGVHPLQQRLAFEELMAHSLAMEKLRRESQQHHAPVFSSSTQLQPQFLQQLPFALTGAQQRVLQEIQQDLQQDLPMMRLVQGDVGAGKTVVAALAMLQAVEHQYQAALMAPTEILAEQHYQNFKRWFEPLGIHIAWLSGTQKARSKRDNMDFIATGAAAIAVGTHALFQDKVSFAKLGLVVIDEQHRFGVHQRLSLRNKGAEGEQVPHQLIMTATPIPRSLAMTAYGDLDYSVIDELPPGRTPVTTVAIANDRRDDVIQRVHQACRQQRQAYWVCTLIEESETLQSQAAEATVTQLREELPDLKIGLVHGRMSPSEKETTMQAFKQAELDLLVATTVIEVGVDVPNASLMIIENPERLGLSQLHQLRGRVGRGSAASHCVLMYQAPLSEYGKQRLQVMRETSDGFIVAQRDLELRGPGEVLGTRQTGLAQYKIADLIRDAMLLPKAKQAAKQLFHENGEVAQRLIENWVGDRIHYIRS